jgi:hypothetical protein
VLWRAAGGATLNRQFSGLRAITCLALFVGIFQAWRSAQIPAQQFQVAPPRQVHDHSLIGVDFALDSPSQEQATESSRTALLQKAATFFIDRGSIGSDGHGGVGFDVFIANSGTGHDLPSGFAFAPQMWVEITATDSGGSPVFTSGVLAQPTDDLCDGEVLLDLANPMQRFFQACPEVDQQLVTLQQKLVDLAAFQFDGSDPFDPAGATKAFEIGEETWLQYLHAGSSHDSGRSTARKRST